MFYAVAFWPSPSVVNPESQLRYSLDPLVARAALISSSVPIHRNPILTECLFHRNCFIETLYNTAVETCQIKVLLACLPVATCCNVSVLLILSATSI
jgi:hypothetical protein